MNDLETEEKSSPPSQTSQKKVIIKGKINRKAKISDLANAQISSFDPRAKQKIHQHLQNIKAAIEQLKML